VCHPAPPIRSGIWSLFVGATVGAGGTRNNCALASSASDKEQGQVSVAGNGAWRYGPGGALTNANGCGSDLRNGQAAVVLEAQHRRIFTHG